MLEFTTWNSTTQTLSHHHVLRQSQEAGRPRRPCCRRRCGSPAPRPAASSPAWSPAECPRTWSPGSLCWAWSLCGPRWGPVGKRTPVCEARSKGPVAAAAAAQEDVRSSSSMLRAGRPGPPRTSPRGPCTGHQGPVRSQAPAPALMPGCCWCFLPEEGAPAHPDFPSLSFNTGPHKRPPHQQPNVICKSVGGASPWRAFDGLRQRQLLCWF